MKSKIVQLFLLLCLAPFTQIATAQTTIFNYGDAWKYLDNGSNQGTAWTGTGFSDASWSSGTGYFGYGDTWINTCVNACGTVSCSPSCGTKYITTYFRKVVNIPSTAIFDSIKLNLYRDDGMVVYVNGVEVWRDNMPTGTVSYTTTAPVAIGGTDETTAITKTIPISYFSNGNNTIAVELHQQAGTSSDLTFNMEMIGIPSLTLFDYGSSWKYLDNGSNQGTGWTATGFADGGWASDTGYFGYGDPWINRCVNACGTVSCSPSCTNKYVTTYFRKTISIPNPSIYDSIRFYAKRDDGIVVYVNGTEVWRDNMPTGTIAYNTLAPVAINAPDETTAVVKTIPISYFTVGANTLAVEVHQQAGTSSDLTFNMKMMATPHVVAPAVTLAQGPYLQMGSQTAVNVRWRTNIASKSRVAVGTTLGTYPIVVNDATTVTEHELRITGLSPDTKYYYRFGTDTNFIQGDSTNFFVTAPSDTSTRQITIAAFGDCGRNDNNFQTGSLTAYQNYLASQNKKAADMMLLIGDNAYDAGTDAEFSANFFARYSSNILKNHMLFPAPGNHDYANSSARQADHNVPYYNLFSLPSAGECGGVPSGTEAYYSYNWGNVHILSLDSYGQENAGTTRLYDTTGAQVTWIKNDLAANTKKWTIAYWHHPPYTMGSHNSDGEAELVNIRQRFIKILERNGVDMIICGHSHDYERSYLLKGHYGNEASFNKAAHTADSSSGKYDGTTNSCPYTVPSGRVEHGTVYVVTGSAGADGGVQAGYPHNALPFSIDDGGMFYIDIKNNRLDAKFLRRDNTIADQFTIMKDVKVKDTVAVFPGATVNLNATWLGGYAWSGGATTRAISVTAIADTLITVKDSLTRTCLTDQHYIDVVCTMPVFTTCPGNRVVSGCNNIVTYSIADTATPNPTLTYTFTGATTGSGTGTGSGSVFNVGVTNVTVTATNACGSVNCNFTITVNPLPATVSVTGSGPHCDSATIVASNGGDGVIYYQGATSLGTSTVVPATSQIIASSGIYYFRALGADGCWGAEGSAIVTINASPNVYTVTGGGAYCAGGSGINIILGSSATGIAYELLRDGSSVSAVYGDNSPLDFGLQTAAGVYTVRATDTATGCLSPMNDSATVTVLALPVQHTVVGGGSYCTGATGLPVGIDNADPGMKYQLVSGILTIGAPVNGVGAPIDFGIITAPGNYKVIATDTLTGCAATMTDSAIVVENPLPLVYNVSGGGAYCAGDAGMHVDLNGSATGIIYQLYHNGLVSGAPIIGTNAALDFGLQTVAGVYKVEATDATTGCHNAMNDSATIIINSLPAVHHVTGGGAYCSGGTGLLIGLDNSDNGNNYQLYKGVLPVGTAVAGTGAAIDYGATTAPGVYKVIATDALTGCFVVMADSAIVVENSLPVAYNLTGGGAYCAGGSGVEIGLTNGATGIAYQLRLAGAPVGAMVNGAGGPLTFGAHMGAGLYTVTATDTATGCAADMLGSATVSINTLPVVYNLTGGGAYCAGSSGVVTGLSGSEAGVSYQLYNSGTPVGSPLSGTGTALDYGYQTVAGAYSVIATNDATHCLSTMTGIATVAINPLPTVYTATGGGAYCAGGAGVAIALSGSDMGIAYQLNLAGTPIGSALAGSGSAISFGLQTAAGFYSVSAVNTTTGCMNIMAGSPTISINTLPVLFSVTGGGSYCAGGSGVRVGLGGSVVGINYQLYNGAAPEGGATSGSGLPLNFGLQTAGGRYTVVATNPTTACVSLMPDTATITVVSVVTPTVSINAVSSVVCTGDTLTLTATSIYGGLSPVYDWMINGIYRAGGATYSYVPANGDNIRLRLTSNATCRTVDTAIAMLTQTVTTRKMPRADINVVPGNLVCDGSAVTFVVAPTNGGTTPTYTWIKNTLVAGTGATYRYAPVDGDEVILSMNSNLPCRLANTVYSNNIKMEVSKRYLPLVEIVSTHPSIIGPGKTDTLTAIVTGGGPEPTYKWVINGNVVPGATTASLVYSNFSNGDSVSCIVTGTGTCSYTSFNSIIVRVGNVGVNTVNKTGSFILSPNPNNGSFNLTGTFAAGTNETATIEVTDMLGRKIYSKQLLVAGGRINEQIDLNNELANGIYLFNLRSATDNVQLHFVVSK